MNKQMKVFAHIMQNRRDLDNLFLGSYSSIEKSTGVSRPTVAKMMKKLQERGVIEKINNGVWLVKVDMSEMGIIKAIVKITGR